MFGESGSHPGDTSKDLAMGRMWEATAYSCGGGPKVYVVPDLHKGPRMSPKMAPLVFTKMSGNLSSVQPKPKW